MMSRQSFILLSHFNAIWRFLTLDKDKVSMREIDIIFNNRPRWVLHLTAFCLRCMSMVLKILTVIRNFQSKK